MDPVNTIKCNAAVGFTCIITDTASVQESSSTGDADNYIAIPWQIDGNYVGEGGPFFASAPSDGSYAGGTWTDQQTGVSRGTHTLQTFAFSYDGANLDYWTVTYNVYQS